MDRDTLLPLAGQQEYASIPGVSGAVFEVNPHQFARKGRTVIEENTILNDVLDRIYAFLDTKTASAGLPYYRREAKLRSIMAKLDTDLKEKERTYQRERDPHSKGVVNAMSVHLLLSNEYGLLSIKESKVLLDYIINQTHADEEANPIKMKVTGDPIKDNASFMEQ